MAAPLPEPAQPAAEAGHTQLEPGAWVGRYQVEALLGRGGMGAVYRARDSVLERTVALKTIRFGAAGPGEPGDPTLYTRFRREAMALAQLNHRNVCQVHDWVEWEGGAFIAMEHIEGETLAEAGAAMDLHAKLAALRSIASALAVAHAKGIVHRDLKPSNIMVDQDGRVKVLDFGLARFLEPGEEGPGAAADPTRPWHVLGQGEATSVLPPEVEPGTRMLGPDPDSYGSGQTQDSLTRAGSFMGSPAYASPEQMCRLQVGPPSDIFSLGVLAWELLLGDQPFPGKGSERMAATVAGRIRSLAGRKLHPRLAGLLRAMLAQHPADRPSAQRVVETLSRQLKPFPTAVWAALAAALLFLALGVGHALLGRGVIADLIKDRPPRLVVLPIRNLTPDPGLGPLVEVGMTELLAAALRDSPNLTVVEAESVTRALANLHLEPGRALEPEAQTRLLQSLGAPLVLQGALERDPGGALVFRYALRTRSGSERHHGSVTVAGGGFTAYALVDPAARELLRKVDPLGRGRGRGGAPPVEAFEAYARGKALFLKGDFKGSEPLLREAALGAPAFSQAVTAYASCLRRLGREQAVLVTNWAILAARATGDRWAEGRALGVKAYLARDRGDLAEAEQLRRTTLELAESLHDLDGAAVASNHLGLIAAERGQDDVAEGFYLRSLELSRQVADMSYIGLAQNNLANLALKRGDLRGAAGRYQEALATQRSMGNRFGEALALNNLGVVALTSGNLAEAEGHLGKALALREAAGDQAGRATSLRNLGILALIKGELDQAQALYERALAASGEAGVRAIEAECRFCLGELLRLRQRFRPAQEAYRKAVELLAPGVTPQVRAGALAGLAECAARSGPGGLKEAHRQLEALPAQESGSPYALRAWAWVHFLERRPELALAELDKARQDWITAPEMQRELAGLRAQFARR